MVLFGKILNSETSCLLFKMPEPSADTLNVFMACPLHVLNPNDFKIKIQVVGNNTTRILSSPLFITAVLFPVQHPFLDLALGVIQDPEIINNTPELLAISYLSVDDSNQNIQNRDVDVLYANRSGGVSRLPSRILSMNYEMGSQEQSVMTHSIPASGGFIQVEIDAKSGLSGGLVVNRGNNPSILGMIIISSSTSSNEEDSCTLKTCKNLASKMFYIAPHILQCTSRFYRLTLNDPVRLANLSKFNIMRTFEDDARPVVNHLGGDYKNHTNINQMNPFRHLTLSTVHNFLSVSPLVLNQENETNSIRIRTAINDPDSPFLNYFFSKQENSVVLIRSVQYTDKIKDEVITLNFDEDEMANILDWCYRGDPLANLVLNCQLRTVNNNGTVSLTPENSVDSFTFLSSETTDTIHGRDYRRTSMQIPGPFFNKLNSFEVLAMGGFQRLWFGGGFGPYEGRVIKNEKFTNRHLEDANFSRSDIRYSNFTNANLTNANFSRSGIRYSNFTNANLTNADFRFSGIRYSNFTNANLTNADFRGLDLTNADFRGSNLTNADFRGSNADFSGPNFKNTNHTKARKSQNTDLFYYFFG